MKSIEKYWDQPTPASWLLLVLLSPLSLVYCALVVLRRKLYMKGVLKSQKADIPVVVIGNIVVGGSGKTPLLIALCEYVKSKGYKPGVVSRGYGGRYGDSNSDVKQVAVDDTAELVGDEPLMIHQRTGVPVVVCADRARAVEKLLADNDCDIVFSDDGMQHYRMARDMEIAVVDAERRFGNGFTLPAGPLRERRSRLDETDLVVFNGQVGGHCSYSLQGRTVKQVAGVVSKDISEFSPQSTIHAVAGIGNPARFFDQLRRSGFEVIEHAFADHHQYQQQDFDGWQDDCIIMTEKDAVKCINLALADAWYLEVEAVFSDLLEAQLEEKLLPLLNSVD